MSDKPTLTPEQMSVLLKIVTAKTGKDPIDLKKELSGESADGILDALGADREKLLLELGLRDTPILTVYNKCDRLAALNSHA